MHMRRVLAVHARGIRHVAKNDKALPPKSQAFALCAKLFLMQHSCHWYYRSKTVASSCRLARHRTSYSQLPASVNLGTRKAYGALVA